MNELSYKLIIDKMSKRQIDSLSLLLQSKKPIPIASFMKQSNVSRKTIRKDFDNLQERFPENIHFTEYHGTPAVMLIGNTSDVEDYMDSLIVDNPLFLVIEKSFFSETETIESIADELFIADSTLRKYLIHLKNILKEYDLSLNLKPIRITGNELNIRYFYFSYFDQPSRSKNLKISPEQNTALYETIKTLTNQYSNVLNIEYHRLIKWLIIFENRLSQKKYVHFDDDIYEKYSNDAAFLMLHKAMKLTFKGHILSDLSNHEMLAAYLIIFDTIIYDKNEYFFVNDFYERLKPFELITTMFFKESNLDFGVHIDLKILLQAFLANLDALTDLSALFQKNDTQLEILVEKKYPDMLKQWVTLLETYYQFQHSYDVAVSLTILTVSNIKRNKRVLLSLSGSPSTINYYKTLVEKVLPRGAELIWNSKQPLDNSLIEKMKIDICIHNFPPSDPITSCQTFYISKMPLEMELEHLLLVLNKI